MAKSQSNRVISYFFIFDFYHNKGSNDQFDLFPESIIYFYPPREEIKKEKLLACGEMVALIDDIKYKLFSSIPKEFHYKKSLVTNEYYGRHCAFLVLSKDRFTIDEANVHLTHILQLFHLLYGSLNHVYSIYTDINELHLYLKQTLTPILEHVFNENRSIRNLFSAIDYAPIKKNYERFILHIKHFLSHLQSNLGVRNGFFAMDKRILYSTYDIDTTFYIQVILDLERHLPAKEIYLPLRSETKLRNGVSLLRIFLPRSSTFDPFLNSFKANTLSNSSTENLPSQPVSLNRSITLLDNDSSSVDNDFISPGYTTSVSNDSHPNIIVHEGAVSLSEDTQNFDTDATQEISPSSTEPDCLSTLPSARKTFPSVIIDNPPRTIFTSPSEEGQADVRKNSMRTLRPRTGTVNDHFEDSMRYENDSSNSNDRLVQAKFEIVPNYSDFDSCEDFCPENTIDIPQRTVKMNFHSQRRKTLTNDAEYNPATTNQQVEDNRQIADVPEFNEEIDRDELVLYVQRNSRMTFTGIMEKSSITDEYLQKIWWLIVNGIAEMDRDIQVYPIAGETSANQKDKSDIKFQFHDHTHQVQYECLYDINNIYYKIPSSDGACMAFSARVKMNENSERKMIGLSRGNNVITVNRYIPDRATYLYRRVQEPR